MPVYPYNCTLLSRNVMVKTVIQSKTTEHIWIESLLCFCSDTCIVGKESRPATDSHNYCSKQTSRGQFKCRGCYFGKEKTICVNSKLPGGVLFTQLLNEKMLSSSLVQILVCRLAGAKPLSETSSSTQWGFVPHVCVDELGHHQFRQCPVALMSPSRYQYQRCHIVIHGICDYLVVFDFVKISVYICVWP